MEPRRSATLPAAELGHRNFLQLASSHAIGTRLFAAVLRGGLLVLAVHPTAGLAADPDEVFQRAAPSVVIVTHADAKGGEGVLGSGVVIGAGEVITNCHVASDGERLAILRGKASFPATLRHADRERDLCLLQVSGLTAPAARLGSTQALKVGQRVYAIGAPLGLELSLSEGLISALRPLDDALYIQTSAAISPGSSGGGLFDAEGALVGVTTFYLAGGQSLNFALPVDWIGEVPQRATQVAAPAGTTTLEWLNRASALGQRQDWAALLELAQRWTRSEPDDADAWCVLGGAYTEQGQYPQAVQALQKALRLKPDYAEAWFNLGVAHTDQGQSAQAAQALQEAFRLKPDYANAWYGHQFSYGSQGRWENVRQTYQKLRELDPALADRFFDGVVMP